MYGPALLFSLKSSKIHVPRRENVITISSPMVDLPWRLPMRVVNRGISKTFCTLDCGEFWCSRPPNELENRQSPKILDGKPKNHHVQKCRLGRDMLHSFQEDMFYVIWRILAWCLNNPLIWPYSFWVGEVGVRVYLYVSMIRPLGVQLSPFLST